MGAALRLLMALAERRLGIFGQHAKARAGHVAALAVFGLATAAFLLALATVALAGRIGTMAALGTMAGLSALVCAGVLIAMRAEGRAHAAKLKAQEEADRRALQTAALVALPTLRRGGILAAGLAGLAALLLLGRGRRR